jgi:hypothetical protein
MENWDMMARLEGENHEGLFEIVGDVFEGYLAVARI